MSPSLQSWSSLSWSEISVPLGIAFVTAVALVSMMVLERSRQRARGPVVRSTVCRQCTVAFGLLQWQYVCDACRTAFCHAHCRRVIRPPRAQVDRFVRLCDACYARLAGLDLSRTEDVYEPEAAALAAADAAAGRPIPVAIVLHGAACTRMNLLPQIRDLQRRGYRVIALDLPGHGSRRHEPLTLDSAVAVVSTALRTCTAPALESAAAASPAAQLPARALLLGHSIGAYIAIHVAALFPDRVSGLVVSGAGRDFAGRRPVFLRLLRQLYRLLPDEWLASLVPQAYPSVPSERMAECVTRCGMFYEAWPGIEAILLGASYEALLRRITVPVLLINGERDDREDEQRLLRACSRGTLEVVPGASHGAPLERPDAYRAALDRWLGSIVRDGLSSPSPAGQ